MPASREPRAISVKIPQPCIVSSELLERAIDKHFGRSLYADWMIGAGDPFIQLWDLSHGGPLIFDSNQNMKISLGKRELGSFTHLASPTKLHYIAGSVKRERINAVLKALRECNLHAPTMKVEKLALETPAMRLKLSTLSSNLNLAFAYEDLPAPDRLEFVKAKFLGEAKGLNVMRNGKVIARLSIAEHEHDAEQERSIVKPFAHFHFSESARQHGYGRNKVRNAIQWALTHTPKRR